MDADAPSLTQLTQQAIQAALAAQWDQALELNQQIIAADPKNVDALNRAARAFFELGNLKDSKKLYQDALTYDPYNQIAGKFLKRIATFKGDSYTPNGSSHTLITPDLFIKEPGKSMLVNLSKLAEPQKLSMLSSGCRVNLHLKNHAITVIDPGGDYVGTLPDDVSHRLIRFIKGGNKYASFIKSIKPNAVTVLIKENFRAARFKNQPSFPEASDFSYSSDHISLADDNEAPVDEGGEDEESS